MRYPDAGTTQVKNKIRVTTSLKSFCHYLQHIVLVNFIRVIIHSFNSCAFHVSDSHINIPMTCLMNMNIIASWPCRVSCSLLKCQSFKMSIFKGACLRKHRVKRLFYLGTRRHMRSHLFHSSVEKGDSGTSSLQAEIRAQQTEACYFFPCGLFPYI